MAAWHIALQREVYDQVNENCPRTLGARHTTSADVTTSAPTKPLRTHRHQLTQVRAIVVKPRARGPLTCSHAHTAHACMALLAGQSLPVRRGRAVHNHLHQGLAPASVCSAGSRVKHGNLCAPSCQSPSAHYPRSLQCTLHDSAHVLYTIKRSSGGHQAASTQCTCTQAARASAFKESGRPVPQRRR